MRRHVFAIALSALIAGCSSNSHTEKLSIPVVDLGVKYVPKMQVTKVNNKDHDVKPFVPSVFVPPASKPIEQQITFSAPVNNTPPRAPEAAKVKDIDQRIDELTEKYSNGDAEAAYQLVALLLKKKRVEEAEIVLDYAARQNHVKSMVLYARYFRAMGDRGMAKKWYVAAAKAGSQDAKKELKTI